MPTLPRTAHTLAQSPEGSRDPTPPTMTLSPAQGRPSRRASELHTAAAYRPTAHTHTHTPAAPLSPTANFCQERLPCFCFNTDPGSSLPSHPSPPAPPRCPPPCLRHWAGRPPPLARREEAMWDEQSGTGAWACGQLERVTALPGPTVSGRAGSGPTPAQPPPRPC